MLRPSDIAQKSRVFNKETGTFQHMVFATNHVQLNKKGSAEITLHGIKNDYLRNGFSIILRPSQSTKLDPVKTLQCYIS